ncbi:MAG: tetratricopeptide repeat protein [Gemmatimonadales bacterium]
MRLLRILPALALLAAPSATTLVAQGGAAGAGGLAAHVAIGDSLFDALKPADALRHYEAALAVDSTNYGANWKAARAIADVAKQILEDDDASEGRRDSLYNVGRAYAERAVRADSTDAWGHYALAMVLGRLSLTKGSKERVRFAKIIFDEASRALQIDSVHAGAHHVLGAWHANVKRLSGIQRFFARMLFGGGFLSQGNWPDAQRHLERAVTLRPGYIYSRLELARVYADIGRYTAAREQLTTIARLPDSDVLDHEYRREAAELLQEIQNKTDRTS